MFAQSNEFFLSFFANPNAIGILLAIAFGAIWLVCYRPPLFKQPWLWAVMASSALLTLVAISFIQIPLQTLTGQALTSMGMETLQKWLYLAVVPQILFSGLVQEASKLVPVIWWRFKDRTISPKMGIMIGAVAGAGFGIFEAIWVHDSIFAAGWSWSLVQSHGVVVLLGFWERFFAVAFHIATSALAGYGLAKGRGWQFYLLAAGLHGVLNYGAVLAQHQVLGMAAIEAYVAVIAVGVTAFALWLRWKKSGDGGQKDASLSEPAQGQ